MVNNYVNEGNKVAAKGKKAKSRGNKGARGRPKINSHQVLPSYK